MQLSFTYPNQYSMEFLQNYIFPVGAPTEKHTGSFNYTIVRIEENFQLTLVKIIVEQGLLIVN